MERIYELYDLFYRNFPTIVRSEDDVKEILSHSKNHIIMKNMDDVPIAVSVINENSILMLCVDKEYRHQGYGAELLTQSEEYIRQQGYERVIMGVGFNYLMPGVPILDDNKHFFEKRGYVHAWDDTECFDMAMSLENFTLKEQVGDRIDSICYRFASSSDFPQVIECVRDAKPDFVPYYQSLDLSAVSNQEWVLIAVDKAEICGAIIVSKETDAPNTGTLGCTSVKKNYQHKGIATNMVRIATAHLKSTGMKYGYLSYTYSGLEKLYGAAGYEVTTRYMMAEKEL